VHHVDCVQKPLEGLFIAVRFEQFPTLFLCPPVDPAPCPTTSHRIIFDVGKSCIFKLSSAQLQGSSPWLLHLILVHQRPNGSRLVLGSLNHSLGQASTLGCNNGSSFLWNSTESQSLQDVVGNEVATIKFSTKLTCLGDSPHLDDKETKWVNSSTQHIEGTNLAPASRHPTGGTGWSQSNRQAQNPAVMRHSGLQVPAQKKDSKNVAAEAGGLSFFPFDEHRCKPGHPVPRTEGKVHQKGLPQPVLSADPPHVDHGKTPLNVSIAATTGTDDVQGRLRALELDSVRQQLPEQTVASRSPKLSSRQKKKKVPVQNVTSTKNAKYLLRVSAGAKDSGEDFYRKALSSPCDIREWLQTEVLCQLSPFTESAQAAVDALLPGLTTDNLDADMAHVFEEVAHLIRLLVHTSNKLLFFLRTLPKAELPKADNVATNTSHPSLREQRTSQGGVAAAVHAAVQAASQAGAPKIYPTGILQPTTTDSLSSTTPYRSQPTDTTTIAMPPTSDPSDPSDPVSNAQVTDAAPLSTQLRPLHPELATKVASLSLHPPHHLAPKNLVLQPEAPSLDHTKLKIETNRTSIASTPEVERTSVSPTAAKTDCSAVSDQHSESSKSSLRTPGPRVSMISGVGGLEASVQNDNQSGEDSAEPHSALLSFKHSMSNLFAQMDFS